MGGCTMNTAGALRSVFAAAWGAGLALLLVACSSGPPAVLDRETTPSFADASALANRRADAIDDLIADHVLRLRYADADGAMRDDQVEGTVQIRRPGLLSLSLRKVVQRVAWIGYDGDRCWWINLLDEKWALVGSPNEFAAALDPERVLPIAPHELLSLLGMDSIDPSAPGAVQWSADGARLGVTTRREDGGYRRVWLDPDTGDALGVELYDGTRRALVVSTLSRHRDVRLKGRGRVRLPGLLEVQDPRVTGSLRMTLDRWRTGTDDRAFELESLASELGVDRIERLGVRGAGG